MNIIEIERLEKSFDIGDSKVKILKGINLQIQKGDFVCIMGASGSGKTTLLQLLGGLDIPTVGSIRVDGTEISTLKEKELALFRRHKIGFIFQQFNLIPVFSAEENVGLPLLLDNVSQKKATVTANRLLDLVGLKGKEKHLPADLVVRVPMDSQGIEVLPFSWMGKIKKVDGVDASVGNATDFTAKLINYDFKKANQEWYEHARKNNFNYDSIEVVGNDIVAYQKVTKAKVISGQNLNKPLQDGEGVVTKETAKNLGIQLHDTIEVQGKGKEKQTIKVVSIIEQGLRLRGSDIFVSEQWARDKFHVQGYEAIQIMTNSNQSFEVIKKQVKQITNNKENVEVINSYDLLKEQEQLLSQMMMLIRLLVVIVFIISGIGLMNAIVASLHERRAEISMIRAVGAIPKQMRRIVLLEGTLLGAIAGCIGIFGGILFSYIVLSSLELTVIIIPYNQVVILALASVMLGAGAAMIASLQLRRFKLSDTLKDLSA